jgi:hypothetical protein
MKNIRNISIVIALITGLPAFLAENGLDLPDAIDVISNKVVSIAGIIAAIIAQISVPYDTVEPR